MRIFWLALATLTLVAATSCTSGSGDDQETGGDMDAATMKKQVDEAVLAMAPDLASEFQGEIRTAGAQFTKCQMTSDQWEYAANIGLVAPATEATATTAGEAIRTVARAAGFDHIEVKEPTPEDAGSVTAHKGAVKLYTLLAFSAKPATVHNIEVSIGCTKLDEADQDVAATSLGADYPELR